MRATHSSFIAFALIFLFSCPALAKYEPAPINPKNVRSIKSSPRHSRVVFKGNHVLDDRTLNQSIGLSGTINSKAMSKGVRRLYKLYHKHGYSLVQIRSKKVGRRWVIYIHEGHLKSIHIIGLGWYETLMFRRNLFPGKTFNKNLLEKKLSLMKDTGSFSEITYEHVEVENFDTTFQRAVGSLGETLSSRNDLMTSEVEGRYDLYIYFKKKKRLGSWGFGLGYNSSDGAKLKAGYGKKSFFLAKDRLELNNTLGMNLRSSIDPSDSGRQFYHTIRSNSKWWTPPLRKRWLRLHAEFDFTQLNEQRPDLPLDLYRFVSFSPGLYLDLELIRNKTLNFSGGYDFRHAFNLDRVPSNSFTSVDQTDHSVFAGAGIDVLFGKAKIRKSWNHTLTVDTRFHLRRRDGRKLFHETLAKYQNAFTSHLTDTYIKASIAYLGGEVYFFDEVSLSELGFSSSFNRRFYVRKGGSAGGEVRLNVYNRDIQVAVYEEVLLFEKINNKFRAGESESLEFANSAGPGIYFLFFDAFELQLKYGFGFTGSGNTSHDVMIGFKKVL